MNYHFIIPGRPSVQKQTRKSGNHFFDPSKKDKERIQWYVKQNFIEDIICEPIELTIEFYLPIPKSCSKNLQSDMENQLVLPDKRPDIDNMAYIVSNALTGIVYDDDKRICQLFLFKYYSDNPRTEIFIHKLNL